MDIFTSLAVAFLVIILGDREFGEAYNPLKSTSQGRTCHPFLEKQCESGLDCYFILLECDGVPHCPDGSDEAHCADRLPKISNDTDIADQNSTLTLPLAFDGKSQHPESRSQLLPESQPDVSANPRKENPDQNTSFAPLDQSAEDPTENETNSIVTEQTQVNIDAAQVHEKTELEISLSTEPSMFLDESEESSSKDDFDVSLEQTVMEKPVNKSSEQDRMSALTQPKVNTLETSNDDYEIPEMSEAQPFTAEAKNMDQSHARIAKVEEEQQVESLVVISSDVLPGTRSIPVSSRKRTRARVSVSSPSPAVPSSPNAHRNTTTTGVPRLRHNTTTVQATTNNTSQAAETSTTETTLSAEKLGEVVERYVSKSTVLFSTPRVVKSVTPTVQLSSSPIGNSSHCQDPRDFPCHSGHICVYREHCCDRFIDCPDASDEQHCNYGSCLLHHPHFTLCPLREGEVRGGALDPFQLHRLLTQAAQVFRS